MDLGNTIKNIRHKKGIKQNALAKSSGISPTYLSQIESNIKEPNISTLKSICEALDLPLPVLFFLSINDDDIAPEKHSEFKQLEPSIKALINDYFNNPEETE